MQPADMAAISRSMAARPSQVKQESPRAGRAVLDLKQATAAVFYALGRGWLPLEGLHAGSVEEATEHVKSEGDSIVVVLVRETERSRALISASITEHTRRAGSIVRDSYPAGGVSWQKILDHLTKSGRGKFESAHRGKVTAGSWRRYELKQCTQPHELLQWVRQVVPSMGSDDNDTAAEPRMQPLPLTVCAPAYSGASTDEYGAQLLQQTRAALNEEVRSHARTKRQLETTVSRNITLELRVRELEQALAGGGGANSSHPNTAPTSPSRSSSSDSLCEDAGGANMFVTSTATASFHQPAAAAAAAPAAAAAAAAAPVAAAASRGTKRQASALYGTRRLWRVVTPAAGSQAQRQQQPQPLVAAVERLDGLPLESTGYHRAPQFNQEGGVDGAAGNGDNTAEGGGDRGILPTATAVEAADDLGEQAGDYRGEPADDLSAAAGAAGGSTSPMLLPPDLDAGWEPTDLGPIQFA